MTNYILGKETFANFADLVNAYFKKFKRYPTAPKNGYYVNGIWSVWY